MPIELKKNSMNVPLNGEQENSNVSLIETLLNTLNDQIALFEEILYQKQGFPSKFQESYWDLISIDSVSFDLDITEIAHSLPSLTNIAYRLNGGSAVLLGFTTPQAVTISSLTPNTLYNVEIRGVNSVGNGPWSEIKAITTPAA